MLKRFSLSLLIVVVIIIGGACGKAKEVFSPPPTPTPVATPTPVPTPTPTPSPTPTPAGIKYTENNIDQKMKREVDVNPSTLEMSLNLTLADYPDRGGNVPVKLKYNSKVWRMDYLKAETGSPFIIVTATPKYAEHSVSGWTTSMDEPNVEYSPKPYNDKGQPYCTVCGDTGSAYYIDRVTVHLPGGYTNTLGKKTDEPVIKPNGEKMEMSGEYVSIDDSRLKYDVAKKTIYFPDGSRYILTEPADAIGTTYIDRNGNKRFYRRDTKQWVDSMERPIGFALNNKEVGPQEVTLPDANNGQTKYIFVWKRLSDVLTNGGGVSYEADNLCTPDNSVTPQNFLFKSDATYNKACGASSPFDPVVLHKIILPIPANYSYKREYTFTYNVYGEIDAVLLPKHGYQRYVYDEIPALDNDLQPKLYGQANRGVKSKFASETVKGSSELEWKYLATNPWSDVYKVSFISPGGGMVERELYYSISSTSFGVEDQRSGIAYEERYFDNFNPDTPGREKLLRRVLSQYDVTPVLVLPGINSLRYPRLTKQVEVHLDNGQNLFSATSEFKHDGDLNIISEKKYDYVSTDSLTARNGKIGSFQGYTLLRDEEYIYFVNDSDIDQTTRDDYRNLNLITLCTKNRKIGSSYTYAATQYIYDEDEYKIPAYGAISNWESPTNTAARGNITTVRKWSHNLPELSWNWKTLTVGKWVDTHSYYDQAGNVVKIVDAKGKVSTFIYLDNFENGESKNTYAYLTSSTNAALQITTSKYNYATGLIVIKTDPNGVATNYEYKDPLNRLTRIINASGQREEKINWDYEGNSVLTTMDLKELGDEKLRKQVILDEYDRIKETREYENSTEYISTLSLYDISRRMYNITNPMRNIAISADAADIYTTTYYDALGRESIKRFPDGSISSIAYSGNKKIYKDEAGITRAIRMNSLGHIVGVTEGSSYNETTYSYSALGNMIGTSNVTQGKYFGYDSLSRLVVESHPERGNITLRLTYLYDDNGNVIEKTDTRGVKTIMTYDELNRITSKMYMGTPSIPGSDTIANATSRALYHYDDYANLPSGAPAISGGAPKGRLIGVVYRKGADTTGTEGTYYKYDAMGRVEVIHQRTGTNNYSTSYSYNLAGKITREIRKDHIIEYAYDDAGRLIAIHNPANPDGKINNIVSNISYTPSGSLEKEALANGLIHKVDYNKRLQPANLRLGTEDNDTSILRIENIFGKAYKNLFSQPFYIIDRENNGNVARINYFIGNDLQHSQTFLYDERNRLSYGVEHKNGILTDSERSWWQSFEYDLYGNGNRAIIINQSSDDSKTSFHSGEFHWYKNWITRTGFSYDDAGNLISEPVMTHTYDGENRIVSTAITGGQTINYEYDGLGRRTRKLEGGLNTIFVYGVNGELLGESNESTSALLKEYLYRNGELLALKEPSLDFKFITIDYFGSPAVLTNWEGGVIPGGRHEYMPFGEELTVGFGNRTLEQGYTPSRIQTQLDGLRIQFKSKIRDIETGLDFFSIRYYSNIHGRFLSPGTMNFLLTDPAYPQRWNRYELFPNQPIK